jgi:TRAP-type transport system periplasmic protein
VKKLFLIPVIIVVLTSLLLGGCSSTSTTTAPTTSASSTPPTSPVSQTSILPATSTAPTTTTAPTTAAAQPIKLTFGSSFNASHPIEKINQAWIDKVQKDTNGRVQITLYTGETLIKQASTWDELTSGVADIAHFSTNSAKSGFAITKALASFSYGMDINTCLKIYAQIEKDFPEVSAEFKGAKVLFYRAAPSNYIFSKKTINTLADLKGLQIQQSPSWPGLIEKMGSTGVMMPFMEVFPSLQKGIIDGAILPADMLQTLSEVISYATNLYSAAPPSGFIIMNQNSWNKLPPDIQKIMMDEIPWIDAEATKILLQTDDNAIAFAKSKGVIFPELSQADLNTIYGYLDQIATKKAADLDAQGLPGTKIYNEWKQLKTEYTKK